jgi:small subunit ribosomal protein S6
VASGAPELRLDPPAALAFGAISAYQRALLRKAVPPAALAGSIVRSPSFRSRTRAAVRLERKKENMAFYEHVVIARQDISPQQAETLNEELKALIESQGGHIAKIEYWGLRNLNYRIKKNRKGHYSLLAIDAPALAVKEMERQLSINEDVLRFLTVRVEALDLELSPVLARRDRDRGDREGRDAPRREFEDVPV